MDNYYKDNKDRLTYFSIWQQLSICAASQHATGELKHKEKNEQLTQPLITLYP